MADPRYRTAFLDWLACAARGAEEPRRAGGAPRSATRSAAAATAGHVLDFDDTYLPGLAHLSAPTAPAALVLGAELGRRGRRARRLRGRASRRWARWRARATRRSTTAAGIRPRSAAGSARRWPRAAARARRRARRARRSPSRCCARAGCAPPSARTARRCRSGWRRRPGVRAARLAAAGARVPLEAAARGLRGGRSAARYAEPDRERAGDRARTGSRPGPAACRPTARSRRPSARAPRAGEPAVVVVVHPVSLQAAAVGARSRRRAPGEVLDPLPDRLHPAPRPAGGRRASRRWTRRRARCARAHRVRTDAALLESEAVLLDAEDAEVARVAAALGSPERPLDEHALARKVEGSAWRPAPRGARRPRSSRPRAAGPGRSRAGRGPHPLVTGVTSTMPRPGIANGHGGST